MCNEVARRIALGQLRDDWSQLKVPLVFPEGLPNLGEQDSIRITDTALTLRAAADGAVEGVMRRWSWPGQAGVRCITIAPKGAPSPMARRWAAA